MNGLPQSSISITLDGVNIQDNTLKTTDGYLRDRQPAARRDRRSDADVRRAGRRRDAVRAACRSSSRRAPARNSFVGSGYHFFQSDFAQHEQLREQRARPAQGPADAASAGLPSRAVRSSSRVCTTAAARCSSSSTSRRRTSRARSRRNSTLLLPDAQNGIFRYDGGPAGGIDLYALAAANGQTATPDPIVLQAACRTFGPRPRSGGRALRDHRQPQHRAVHVPAAVTEPGVLPDDPHGLQRRRTSHRMSGTWYRQRFTDKGFDTTNTRQPTWPGFPLYGDAGIVARGLHGIVPLDALAERRERSAGRLFRRAGGVRRRTYGPDMYTGSLANQGGFSLGLNGALGLTNAGAGVHAKRPQRDDAQHRGHGQLVCGARTAISLGGEYGDYNVWLDTYWIDDPSPSITFGTQTGDPALAMFSAANFPGSSATDRNNAAALYAVLTGRVTTIGATSRLDADTGQYVYQGDSRAEGRLRQADLFVQDNWRVRPNLSLNVGLRYALQLPFYALNNSYSTATVDDVWGVSGYVPGCDMSNPTSETCNLFQPGVMTGQKPTYQNLGEGRAARTTPTGTTWRRASASTGRRRDHDGFCRTLFGKSGRHVVLGRLQPRVRPARHERLHGRVRRQPGPVDQRQSQHGQRQPDACRCCSASGSTSDRRRSVRRRRRPKPTGCMLAAPEYPLSNQTATGSVNVFDPNLQVPYSDTWTVGLPAGARHRSRRSRSATSARAAAQQWETFNYNESNILENNFLDEFKLAQANLQSHIAAGCGSDVEPMLVCVSRSGDRARRRCRSTSRSSAASRSRAAASARSAAGVRDALQQHELDQLELRESARALQLEPVHAGGHELDDEPRRAIPTRQANCDRRGTAGELLPRQSGHARRRQRHRQSRILDVQLDAVAVPPPAVGRSAVRRQLRARPRPSTRRTTRSACRAILTRDLGRRRRRHARVQGDRRLRAAVRQGRRYWRQRRRGDGPDRSAAGRSAARRASRADGCSISATSGSSA